MMHTYQLRLSVLSGQLMPARPGGAQRPGSLRRLPQQSLTIETGSRLGSLLRPLACAAAAAGPGVGLSSLNIPEETSFKVHRITGDGSCMFRALVQGLAQAVSGKPIGITAEAQAAHNLRLAVVDELRRNRSDIEAFIPGIIEGNQTFDSYLDNMSRPGTWGGEPEMVMASNVMKRPIRVWQSQWRGIEPIVTYGEQMEGEPINVLWSGNHYDLLVPDKRIP